MNKLIWILCLGFFSFTMQAQAQTNRLSTSFSVAHNEFAIGRIGCCRQVVRNDRLYSFSSPGTAYRAALNYFLNKYLNLDFGFTLGAISHQPHLKFQMLQNLDLTAQLKIPTLSVKNIHISPYLFTGIGLMLPQDTDFMLPMGLGFRLKLLSGVYAQASTAFYLNLTEENAINEFAHLQHSLGLSFGLNSVKALVQVKDQDQDKVRDGEDDCPNQPGLVEFKGCPDSDGDKVQDSEDDCPNQAGLIQFKGCPDNDGDSIKDSEDDCPNQAGLIQFKGCPDNDGDSIKDNEDDCPNQAGLMEFKGCPDSDGDGLKDSEDDCPNQAGLMEFKGCPDSDGDGLKDSEDECPDEPGLKVLNGCPKTDIEAELEIESSHIQFESGSDIIRPMFYVDLDKIVALMLKYPNTHFRIEGHTDHVGKSEDNQKLSQKRAEAVRNYFVNKGISPDRLSARGYGESKPLLSNKTKRGMRLNKRVEIHLQE